MLSIAPAIDLVDGAIYTARLQYNDSVNNPSAGGIILRFTTLNKAPLPQRLRIQLRGIPNTIPPDQNAKIPVTLWVEFELFEKALPGSVKLKFSRTGGAKDNQVKIVAATAERVLTFARHSRLQVYMWCN